MATVGAIIGMALGAAGCVGLASLPVLFGAAADLPPPRDAPGMVMGGAAVAGTWVGVAVGGIVGYRYAKRRKG